MQIARVCGTVVSNHKSKALTGIKLLLVQFLDANGKPLPQYEVAGDTVGAGLNEWVLVTRGSSARREIGDERPVDAMVVGIIDTVTVGGELIYSKKEAERPY
ncbi:MAG: EutN/CcmL family microcompartment protein [Geminocystis sp.]|nr:EutN/CcmL family microcompartment protein [Geminocystis sp.]HIK38787.1 EutN/CcmL family microcompartment protein [Geminocystis sp. M7585_C2015_104]MCS7147864.1 EutN/CcmL family microcompartment protein [Geminocystis sp.]MCX8079105.1 EutN/CcmL family microcompartment protein [Geminocystis sp.]MDW8117048.1 EutN/CcmL family microcompartment protein [Geminocystis sp.]